MSCTSRVQNIRNNRRNMQVNGSNVKISKSSTNNLKSNSSKSRKDTISLSSGASSNVNVNPYKNMSNSSLDKTITNLKKTIASSNGWAKEYAQRALNGCNLESARRNTPGYVNSVNNLNSNYYYDQMKYGGKTDCCRTSIATTASINSNSEILPLSITTGKINGNVRQDVYINNYSIDKKGYYSYLSFNKEDIYNVIKQEIDNNRAVQVYTGYGSGQHWVTVTGYKTTENGKISFSDLSGIDPWGGYYQSDLSHSSVSRSNEQYLKTNENGQYIVRTYFD